MAEIDKVCEAEAKAAMEAYEVRRAAVMRKYAEHCARKHFDALRSELLALDNAEELALDCGYMGQQWMEDIMRISTQCKERMDSVKGLLDRMNADAHFVPDYRDMSLLG
jgi:hypothetical protein